MMYVIKVGAEYYMGDNRIGALSVHQADAQRFTADDKASIGASAVRALFGPDARFVKLTRRS